MPNAGIPMIFDNFQVTSVRDGINIQIGNMPIWIKDRRREIVDYLKNLRRRSVRVDLTNEWPRVTCPGSWKVIEGEDFTLLLLEDCEEKMDTSTKLICVHLNFIHPECDPLYLHKAGDVGFVLASKNSPLVAQWGEKGEIQTLLADSHICDVYTDITDEEIKNFLFEGGLPPEDKLMEVR